MKARFKRKEIELTGESEPGDEITLAAPKVRFKNFTLAEKAHLYVSNIAKSEKELEIEKNTHDKVEKIIEPRRNQVQKLFGSSMRMLHRLGSSTYVETYTPDPDGNTRVETDSLNYVIPKGGHLSKFFGPENQTVLQRAKDVQSAIDNPSHITLIYARKM